MADVARRMGVKSNYASQYRRRLLEQGIIGEPQRGYLRFDMPGFRDYLATRVEEGDPPNRLLYCTEKQRTMLQQ